MKNNDIIFLEEDFNQNKEIIEDSQNIEEEKEDEQKELGSKPFFIALHKE